MEQLKLTNLYKYKNKKVLYIVVNEYEHHPLIATFDIDKAINTCARNRNSWIFIMDGLDSGKILAQSERGKYINIDIMRNKAKGKILHVPKINFRELVKACNEGKKYVVNGVEFTICSSDWVNSNTTDIGVYEDENGNVTKIKFWVSIYDFERILDNQDPNILITALKEGDYNINWEDYTQSPYRCEKIAFDL
jgi:hypothetical protein